MVRRIISAFIAMALAIGVLYIDRKEIILIAIAFISAVVVYEILIATKYIRNRSVTVISLLFVLAVPFVLSYDIRFINTRYVSFIFIIGLFVVMLFNHKRVNFAEVALVAFVSLCVPFSLSCIVFIYDFVPENYADLADLSNNPHRIFCIVYTLTITWISDSGAFFAGTFLGKHKMAPVVSPKKTWEGFAGGLVAAALFGFLLGKGYEWVTILFTGDLTFKVDVLFLAVLAIPCAVLGVLGDLSASILKRECEVKDFGDIMPGHGGVLDRFDSVLFVVPFAYLVFLQYFPIKAL